MCCSYTVKVQDVEVLFDDDSSARERLRRTLADVLPHTCDPESSLRQGRWFKLICGASYQVSGVQGLATGPPEAGTLN